MALSRRVVVTSATAAIALPALRRSRAEGVGVKVGVLTDMSGPYHDLGGVGAVVCARQAADEAGQELGFPVEVISADHQASPDIGAGIAREWFDRNSVDVIVGLNTSPVALAVSQIARERNKALLVSGAATPDLTGPQCSPNTLHFSADTYMLSKSTTTQVVKAGSTSWFFIGVDYSFGHQLERDATHFVQAAGGKVVGRVFYPFPDTTDFSSYLVQARSSGADVVGFCNSGVDTVNCVKQAHEFGLTHNVRLTVMSLSVVDVRALGLLTAQGIFLTDGFYWDLNDRTRAFTRRVQPRLPLQAAPTTQQAGCYSAARHYLRSAAALGSGAAKDGRAMVAHMKSMPANDDVYGRFTIREDGRALPPTHLFQVKTPAESRAPWDFYNLIATTPPDEAWRPLSEGHCPLVHT